MKVQPPQILTFLPIIYKYYYEIPSRATYFMTPPGRPPSPSDSSPTQLRHNSEVGPTEVGETTELYGRKYVYDSMLTRILSVRDSKE